LLRATVVFALLALGANAARAGSVVTYELSDGRSVTVERYFESDEYSEVYGWRERVIGLDPIFPLEVDCPDAGGFAARYGRLAYHCGQEWIAERLLHAVIVRDEDERQLHYIEHCRDPVWTGDDTISCKAERVTFDGEIALHERHVPLPREIVAQGPAERLWLVMGASERTPSGIARQSKALSRSFPRGFVVQTSDCGAAENMYAWVAEAATSREVAEVALQRLRTVVKNAYIKRCDASPGTLLALRMNAVDESIAEIPEWAMMEGDGVSSVHPLPNGGMVVIPRTFEIEGDYAYVSERISLRAPDGTQVPLVEDCTYPGHFITQGELLAFDCASQAFADELVYHVLVFDRTGRQLAKIERCRYPIWSGDHVIACRKLVWDAHVQEHRLIRTVIRR
jgi:hypothetical protein